MFGASIYRNKDAETEIDQVVRNTNLEGEGISSDQGSLSDI